MIRKPNFKLNWKYALGEVTLIFIGITLAIAFQNWNEKRKEKEIEFELLTQLKEDLIGLQQEVKSDIVNAEKMLQKADSIIDYSSSGSDHEFQKLFLHRDDIYYLSDVQLFPSTATYENLKSVGLEIVSDVELRNKIIDLYDRRLVRAGEWEKIVYQLEDKLITMADKQFIEIRTGRYKYPELAPESYQSFMANKEFYHTLITFQKTRLTTINRYKDVEFLVKELLTSLKDLDR